MIGPYIFAVYTAGIPRQEEIILAQLVGVAAINSRSMAPKFGKQTQETLDKNSDVKWKITIKAEKIWRFYKRQET